MLDDLRMIKESARATAWANASKAGWDRETFRLAWLRAAKVAKDRDTDELTVLVAEMRLPDNSIMWMHTGRTLDETARLVLCYLAYNTELRARNLKDK